MSSTMSCPKKYCQWKNNEFSWLDIGSQALDIFLKNLIYTRSTYSGTHLDCPSFGASHVMFY